MTPFRLLHATPIPRLASSESITSEPGKRNLSTLFKEYGPIAAGVYLALGFTIFLICFTSITILGIDAQTITSAFSRIKSFLGFPLATSTDEIQEEEDGETFSSHLPGFMRNPWLMTILSNALLAMAMTKLFGPIKLGVVLAVTPAVAKRLRAMGFDLGRTKYKDVAKDARDRIKERVVKRV
ncbi:hypothetical protein HDU97_008888 [Phlyctochytrium planicorne]|nr:hypothetical protein HDU97_008888 [Phlyctochytrium planicorne]